jgi:hypothetical protein
MATTPDREEVTHMGARINYVIQDGGDTAVVLYSHWGEDGWQVELSNALIHSKKRWSDSSYATRMIICKFIDQSYGEGLLTETGFGIYSVTLPFTDVWDTTVVIDLSKQTVDGESFESFILEHAGVSV